MRYKFSEIAENSVAKRVPAEDDKQNYIGLEHLISGSLTIPAWGSEVALKGEKLIMKKGDVLFGKRNTYLRRVGIAPHDGLFSAHGMILRPQSSIVDAMYFPFFINSDKFFNEAIKISVGSLSPTVNWKDLKELEFDLPPIERQRELANLLWAANDLKESYKKAIIATDEMLKAKFREMFGDTEFTTIDSVCEILNGYAFKSKEYVSSGVRIIRITNVQKGYIEDLTPAFYPLERSREFNKFLLRKDDLLMSLTGNVGRVGLLPESMLPSALNQRVACLRIRDDSIIDKYFLYAVLNRSEFERDCIDASNGSAQKNASTEWLKKYAIPLPPLSLQREFVAIAERADAAKSALKQSIADIDQVMKGLINQ